MNRQTRVCQSETIKYADVVELADTYDLGSYVARHAGSSPVIRTKNSKGVSFLEFLLSIIQ